MRILIVDDDQNGLLTLEAMLKDLGHEVMVAENGQIALDLARVTPPELIISDILMPVMDGYKLCREWQSDDTLSNIPFVFYTATCTDSTDQDLALNMGAERFIVKPIEPDEFSRIFQEIIGKVKKGRVKTAEPIPDEEKAVFNLYNKRLINKLENKILDLEREIAARNQAEETLRENEALFRTLADATYDWEYWIGPDGDILYMSPSCERITGYSPGAFVDDPGLLEKIIHPADRSIVVDLFGKERIDEMLPPIDFRITTRSGEACWISYVCHSVHDADGRYLGRRASNRDIGKRKKMEEELLKAKKLESLGVLAGGIAHDFNNMMMVVLGHITLAQMTAETFDAEETVKLLAEAEKAAMRTKDLTARLITFSQGGVPFKEAVSVEEFLKNSVASALSGSGIVWELYLPDDVWPVEIDESQMRQTVHNIVANAIEAMPGQGIIKVYCRNIDVSEEDGLALKHGPYVKVSLKDQGTGIAEENLSKVFDPYFSTKEMGVQKGMGLGLSVAYSIVKRHGGLITIESQLDVGTDIHVYLPAVSAKREAPDSERDQADVKPVINNQPAVESAIRRVLVMDDEEMVREVSSAMLSSLGYEVAAAVDGVEAIEMYQRPGNRVRLMMRLFLI
ncbi:MAG: response regulator [Deltaproteobacteria bacterium]|nr:response regulator [Deltaproteobacteria bacterium]